MWEIYLRLPVEAVAKGRPRFTKTGRSYTPKKTKDAESELKLYLQAGMEGEEVYSCPLEVETVFALVRPKSVSKKKRPYPSVKPDVDNFVKLLFDAANEIVWKDDAQVCKFTATKIYVDRDPYIDLKIRQFEGLTPIDQPVVVAETELPQDDDTLH